MPANLVELAARSVAAHGPRPLFGEKHGGAWQWTTYARWQAEVDALRGGLEELGVQPGDRVAIVSRNSTAWATAAYASYGLGAAFVPMYEAQRASEWEFILRDCGASVVFGRTPEVVAKLAEMQPHLPALRHIILIEGSAGDQHTMASLAARGRAHPTPPRAVAPDAVATVVYTSGTTGEPKGVVLTHHNVTTNVESTLDSFPLTERDRTVSFLPWAHVFGQTCELHILIAAGASTAFNVDPAHLLDDLAEVAPTVLVAVPKVFNRIHAGVRAEIEKRPRAIRYVFWRGLGASLRQRRGERLGAADRTMLWLASPLFAAVRNKLGGRLVYAISGSATLSREVAELIDALGIDVYEGYGLTETSPIVAMNRPGHRKLGTVGTPLPGVSIELDRNVTDTPGEGEIIVHGPNVMKGYHARPEENAQAFTADGGLRTGDLGRLDADGFLSITGRIKDQYKLENGKYVMPGPLEERFSLSPYIHNVMLHGAGRPYNVAVVAIDAAAVRTWSREHDIEIDPELTRDRRVRALIEGELERLGAGLRSYERPRDFVLTDQPFTIENGLLTPTLKLRRKQVLALYGDALEELYARSQRTRVPPAGAPPPADLAPTPTARRAT